MKGRRPHLHVIGLHDDAALRRPEILQGEDEPLEGADGGEMGKIGEHGDPARIARKLLAAPTQVNGMLRRRRSGDICDGLGADLSAASPKIDAMR